MRVIVTDYKEQIFWQEHQAEKENVSCLESIYIYPELKKQKISGFGGAFTESAAYCFSRLDSEEKEKLLHAYFTEEGLNYTMGRCHINSCDFSLSNYAADEMEEDVSLEHFSLEREEKYILPFLDAAQEIRGGQIKLLLSPWSPPFYMKTNHEMNNGGSLKKEYYARWAQYMVRYIKEIEERGYRVCWLTVQNEPDAVQTWDSCTYTPHQEAEFAGEYLGPEMEKQGCQNVKLFVWDHNKECAYERAKEILGHEGTDRYVQGIAVHWYTGDHFENLALIRNCFPEKEIFFTEGCVEYSRFDRSDEICKAEMYAHDMAGNFRNGISAFLDWNLLLDSQGGPNHVGNFCDAPILCKKDFTGLEKHLSYYYIGHFSRYVKPGACAVWASAFAQEVEYAAFVNPDGERVLVLLNRQDKQISVQVNEKGQGIGLVLKPHTIVTVCWYQDEKNK